MTALVVWAMSREKEEGASSSCTVHSLSHPLRYLILKWLQYGNKGVLCTTTAPVFDLDT